MEEILNIITEIQPYLTIGLGLISILLFILIIILFSSLNKIEKRYRKFMRGTSNKNLEELVTSYLDKVDEATKQSEAIKELYDGIDNRLKECVQKVSIVRYKAFEDIGSDLSFSIALLNSNNDGVIITGIYGRNESTTYAKPIDKGISRYDLSEEEMQVLNEAINK